MSKERTPPMSPAAKDFVRAKLLLLKVLLGSVSIDEYTDLLLDATRRLSNLLFAVNEVPESDFKEQLGQLKQKEGLTAGLILTLGKLVVLTQSQDPSEVLKYIEEEISFFETMASMGEDAGAVQALERQVSDEQERMGQQSWAQLPTKVSFEEWLRHFSPNPFRADVFGLE